MECHFGYSFRDICTNIYRWDSIWDLLQSHPEQLWRCNGGTGEPGDSLIILKSAQGTWGHLMSLFLLYIPDIFHSRRILQRESKIKTLNVQKKEFVTKKKKVTAKTNNDGYMTKKETKLRRTQWRGAGSNDEQNKAVNTQTKQTFTRIFLIYGILKQSSSLWPNNFTLGIYWTEMLLKHWYTNKL